jgi:DNA-directed RNA polymerase subunit H (RpoH/RPB5)
MSNEEEGAWEVGANEERLATAFSTLKAMLKRRGYDDNFEHEGPYVFTGESGSKGRIMCMFSGDWDVTTRIKTVDTFMETLREREIPRGILVAGVDITTQAAQQLRDSRSASTAQQLRAARSDDATDAQDVSVEFFTLQALAFDIMTHYLVPHYEVLEPAEARAELAGRMVTEDQLPEMKPSDPVARYLGLVPSQIVRVTRSNESCGLEVFLRIVR